MLYAAACERLAPRDENEDPEVTRARFDVEMGVKRWLRTDSETGRYADVVVEPGAPWWWEGDEEASASFLASQGVTL